MDKKNNILPWNKNQLWRGCILGSLAHAIMVAHYVEVSHEQSWDGFNYNVQDSAGQRGTITFSNACIAAFRNDNCERARNARRAEDFFQGATTEILKLAKEETLQYLLEDINGEIVPLITAAFWGENELYTTDDINKMMMFGGNILNKQLMKTEKAIQAWSEEYDMNKDQVNLLRSLFARKTGNPNNIITLSKEEINSIGECDEEGQEESVISFSELGIRWNL